MNTTPCKHWHMIASAPTDISTVVILWSHIATCIYSPLFFCPPRHKSHIWLSWENKHPLFSLSRSLSTCIYCLMIQSCLIVFYWLIYLEAILILSTPDCRQHSHFTTFISHASFASFTSSNPPSLFLTHTRTQLLSSPFYVYSSSIELFR